MVKLKETLLCYKNNFEKQIRLSQLEKVEHNVNAFYFYNMIKNTITQHGYKGNIYTFEYSFSTEFIEKSGKYPFQELIELELKDYSNLLNLILFQRLTKIIGVESAIFSLVNVNYKETKETYGLEMEYQGYLMLSEWYDENEKKKIVTSIHAILNHESVHTSIFFRNNNFSYQEIEIGYLGKHVKENCKNWSLDCITLYFFDFSVFEYQLDNEDTDLYDTETLDIENYLLKIHRISMHEVNSFDFWEKWEAYFKDYFTNKNLVKSIFNDPFSSVTQYLLNESIEEYNVDDLDTLKSMGNKKKEKLEAIYEKLENRTKNNSEIWKLKKLKQKWLKMYYLYFLKNDLCAKWNGVYRYKGEELIYYSSYYDLYKRKEEIREWINDLYGFYYMDEEYGEFSYIELLKNKKRLPNMDFYMSMCSEKKEKLTKEVMCMKSYLYNKKNVLLFLLMILMSIQIFLLFEPTQIEAMENSYIWKHGIHVVYGRFDWIQLRKSLFNFYELDLRELELKEKLYNYQGLFYNKHFFLCYGNINEREIKRLTSLTHSNFSGIKISNVDYFKQKKKQYLGELLDYDSNKEVFKSNPESKEIKKVVEYLDTHELDVVEKLKVLSEKKIPLTFHDILLKSYYLDLQKQKYMIPF